MNTRRLIRRRRAVSPILAAILLIGLAVAAGAVLFTVVMPLIDSPGGTLVIVDTKTTLSSTAAHVELRNDGVEDVVVTNITVGNANFTFVEFSIIKAQGANKDYTFDEALTVGTEYTITVTFEVGTTTDTVLIKLTPTE